MSKTKGQNKTGFSKQWQAKNKVGDGGKTVYGSGYSPCRHDPSPVFAIDGITYHACSGNKVDPRWDGTLINLKGDTHLVKPRPVVSVSADWEGILPVGGTDPWHDTIVVDWKDYQAPPVGWEFWETLHFNLRERESNPLLYCVGGHGRTGTAMCSLMLVTGYVDKVKEALDHIHKNYCEQAVESTSQGEYLYRLNEEEMPRKKEESEGWGSWYERYKNSGGLWGGWG